MASYRLIETAGWRIGVIELGSAGQAERGVAILSPGPQLVRLERWRRFGIGWSRASLRFA